jgi:hypothetical protein
VLENLALPLSLLLNSNVTMIGDCNEHILGIEQERVMDGLTQIKLRKSTWLLSVSFGSSTAFGGIRVEGL